MIDNAFELVTQTMERQYPDHVAFRYVAADGETVVEKTYAQYVQDIRRVVTYLRGAIPDIKGKRVALLSKNCYEYGVNAFGIILAGGVVVTLNQKKTWPELEYEIGLVEPSLILNDGVDYGCRDQLVAAYSPILRPMDSFQDSEPAMDITNTRGHDDLMVLMFTSGTTGRSKAVMLSERNFFTTVGEQVVFGDAMLDYKHTHMPENKNDVLSNFCILPLFHLGTFICLFVWPCKGWALNLSSDLRDFYRDVRLMHSDAMAVAPMLMESIYKDVRRGRRERLNGLWNPCGSSAMFDGKMLAELAREDMMITQVYGMTETCGDGIINYAQDEKHIRSMVAIWADMFSEDDAGLVALAVKEHISTSKWPPSIAEIREIMTRIAHPDIIPPDEAWEVVSKYLDTEGEYNHGDIYRALPRTIAEAVDSIGYGQLYAMHVAYARGHAAKAGLDRVAFMQAYEDKVERQRRKAMLPGSLRQKIEAVSAGLDDGTRSLIEGVNRRYEERQALYRRLAEPRDLLALVGGEDAEAKLLEERERRALEARYERDDYE